MSRSAEHAIILTHDGKTDTLSGWANYLGISRQTLFARLKTYGRDNLDLVLISGRKKKGRHAKATSLAKLDGLAEIIASARGEISVDFSNAELERLQAIKQRRRN